MKKHKKRKSEAVNFGLDKQKTSAASEIFSALKILPLSNNVYTQLGDPRAVPCCFACGSTDNIITFHAPGGALGVCDKCNGGIV